MTFLRRIPHLDPLFNGRFASQDWSKYTNNNNALLAKTGADIQINNSQNDTTREAIHLG